MSFQFLYHDDSQGVGEDTVTVLAFINNFFDGLGIHDVQVNISAIESILRGIRQDFPHRDGLENASPFKKAANFVCYFSAEKPITTVIPEAVLGEEFSQIKNEPTNAILAMEIAIEALHGASIHRKTGKILLSDRIVLSNHSYIDVANALCNLSVQAHFPLVAVLFEQMAYKNNPDCQYLKGAE